jgi:hypothetical protein
MNSCTSEFIPINEEIKSKKYCVHSNNTTSGVFKEPQVLYEESKSGSDFSSEYFDIPLSDVNFLANVEKNLSTIKDPNVKNSTIILIIKILKIVTLYFNYQNESKFLPALNFNQLDDNSVLMEWIFKDFRIGFSIEPNSEESSWYLIANNKIDESNLQGLINDKDFDLNLKRLLLALFRNV